MGKPNRISLCPLRLAALAALAAVTSGCAVLGGNVKGSFSCRAPEGNCAPTSVIDDAVTDNAGTPAHNQALSEGRAAAVVAALRAKGIGADRIQAKGYGQAKPIADNGSEDGRAKNRRVELVKR